MKWKSLSDLSLFPLPKACLTFRFSRNFNNQFDQSPSISWTGQKSFLDSQPCVKRFGILSHSVFWILRPRKIWNIAPIVFQGSYLQLCRIGSNEQKKTTSNASIYIQHAKHWRVYLPLYKAMKEVQTYSLPW